MRSTYPEVFCEKDVMKFRFMSFGKYIGVSQILVELQVLRHAFLLKMGSFEGIFRCCFQLPPIERDYSINPRT